MNIKSTLLITLLATATALSARGATCSVPSASYPTIQAAVGDSDCTTVNVAPGVYPENISITHSLTLNGAQAGQSVGARISGGPAESTLQGANPAGSVPAIMIDASHVIVDGFTIKNSVATNAALGIQIKAVSTYGVIQNNFVDGIDSADPGPTGTAAGIFIEGGAFTIKILSNALQNISATQSAHGFLLGDGNAANPLDPMDIEHNSVNGITSISAGAYGLLVVNPTTYGDIFTADNDFSNLEGSTLVHGLSYDAPTGVMSAINNNFTNLIGPTTDNKAIWFSANDPDVYHTDASGNNFNLTIASYGIAIHPSVNVGGNFVNAGCCWWGSPDGPGPVGPGHGARVSPNVAYNFWRIVPDGACVGTNVPTTAAQCKNGGWTTTTRPDGTPFKNQGDCLQYVNNQR
jgi:hypothetical protein